MQTSMSTSEQERKHFAGNGRTAREKTDPRSVSGHTKQKEAAMKLKLG